MTEIKDKVRETWEPFSIDARTLFPIGETELAKLSNVFHSDYIPTPYNFEPTNKKGDIHFIHLPKCAGNFLHYYFLWDRLPVHTITHNGHRVTGNAIEEDFYFTVVRNPFDFWVSMFFFNKDVNQRGTYYWNEKDREEERHSKDPNIIKFHFNNFIDWAYKDWNQERKHLLPLTDNYQTYCYTVDGRYMPHLTCKFETLHNDVGKMLEDLGFSDATKNIKKHSELDIWKNKTKHKKYQEYYKESSIEKVSKIEKYILDKYEYSYD